MGATSYYYATSETDRKKIQADWTVLREKDGRESGFGGYAGNSTTMGDGRVRFFDHHEPANSQSQAEDMLLKLHDKWDNPIAVRFYIKEPPTEKAKERLERMRQKVIDTCNTEVHKINKILQSFMDKKSLYQTCGGCGSKVSRQLINASIKPAKLVYREQLQIPYNDKFYCNGWHVNCIVTGCSHSLLSQSQIDRMEICRNRYVKVMEKYTEMKQPKPSKKIGWIVGGWASC